MALTAKQSELIKLYVAGFLRAPEKGGFEYWSNQLNTSSVAAVSDTIFSLDIVKQVYPDSLNNSAFVTAIYNNVFNKSPDAGGLDYWKGQLDGGKHRGQLVLDMINAGLNVADGTPGKDYIVNRVAVANYTAEVQVTKQKEITPDALKVMLAQVGSASDSVTQIKASIDTAVGGSTAPSSVGQAFANEFIAAVIHWQIDHNQYNFDQLEQLEIPEGATHAQVLDLLTIDLHADIQPDTPGFVTVKLYKEHNWKLTANDLQEFGTALTNSAYVAHAMSYEQAQNLQGYIQDTQAMAAVYDQLVAQAPNYSNVWF